MLTLLALDKNQSVFHLKFLGVSRMFQATLVKISLRVLQESFKVVSRCFRGCFESVSRRFEGSIKGALSLLIMFQDS